MHLDNLSSIQRQLAEILCKIPQEVWTQIVKNDLQWQHLESLRDKLPRGSFSVFMITVGLNAYQLKGRAEMNYWPQLFECLKDCDSISSVDKLYKYLADFYKKERLNSTKIERLGRFLGSSLAGELWTRSPHDLSSAINLIWYSLGNVMKQKLDEKTICFAMKCFGISLMMAGESDFDFYSIPIPVDSRISKFTRSLDIDVGKKRQSIQRFWGDVLTLLRPTLPQINMIHLDSLIWQIAHHDGGEMLLYFESLGIDGVGLSFRNSCFG